MAEYFGPNRKASVSRELTKKFEETANGTLQDLIKHFSAKEVKGEIVMIVAGKDERNFEESQIDEVSEDENESLG